MELADQCRRCRFYIANEAPGELEVALSVTGECHYGPPVLDSHGLVGVFPVVMAGDWCGRFEPVDEESPPRLAVEQSVEAPGRAVYLPTDTQEQT